MGIRVSTFGGRIGWIARKIMPRVGSTIFTQLSFAIRKKECQEYIKLFMRTAPPPLSISLETINRCNGLCSFCPCNVKDEVRPLKYMVDEVFKRIVQSMVDWNYQGRIVMNVNNEPFLDHNLLSRVQLLRNILPNNWIYIITNGTMLDVETVKNFAPFVNRIDINNYSKRMKLHNNLEEIISFARTNPGEFLNIEINIIYRYIDEVLSNRAGTAPNKPLGKKNVKQPCLEPFTGMYIYPDGIVGLCCNDTSEKIKLGDVCERHLEEIWNSPDFWTVREKMRNDRSGYHFCRYCDVFPNESRTKLKRYLHAATQ